MNIVITGAAGLLGWHAAAHLHAANCSAIFDGHPAPNIINRLNHSDFNNENLLKIAVANADCILHFAAVIKGDDDRVATENLDISRRLVNACQQAGVKPHIINANTIQSQTDSVYGVAKRAASGLLSAYTDKYTDLLLPNIFGEQARPFYNNVTATFIRKILDNEIPKINEDGSIRLMHAGDAVKIAIEAMMDKSYGALNPESREISVPDLYEKLVYFHHIYCTKNTYPDLSNDFDLRLFNSYRDAMYPGLWPKSLQINSDERGRLFEAVKTPGGGQVFLSSTEPGVTRGDHFHLNKVERFLVLQGEASIKIRKVLSDDIWEYNVSGSTPEVVDMPTLHTHSITNTGDQPLLTLFWTDKIFDPNNLDTFADRVEL